VRDDGEVRGDNRFTRTKLVVLVLAAVAILVLALQHLLAAEESRDINCLARQTQRNREHELGQSPWRFSQRRRSVLVHRVSM
jgi:hypothetical protein